MVNYYGGVPPKWYRLRCVGSRHSRVLVQTGHYRDFDNHLMVCRDQPYKQTIAAELNGIRKDHTEFPIHLSISQIQTELTSKIILQIDAVENKVKISIIDPSQGISQQLVKQLFQPFASTRESGMGLMLSISHSIIDGHGGKFEFENNKHGVRLFTSPCRKHR